MMMNRAHHDNAVVTTTTYTAEPHVLSPQETVGSIAASLQPPSKPIRQATLHLAEQLPQQQQQQPQPQPPSKQPSCIELDVSLYGSFHLSFSKQDSFGSLTAPPKPVRQATLGTEPEMEEEDEDEDEDEEERHHDSSMLLHSSSLHSSSGTSTSHASSSTASSRFHSLFEIVAMDQGNNHSSRHEASLSALRLAAAPPAQPVRQVTSGVSAAMALLPPPMPTQHVPLAPLGLARGVSGTAAATAAKKPRVTNCKFSKASLLDDDDDDDEEEEEEEEEDNASIGSRPHQGVLVGSPSRQHPSLGMSLSCMTLQGATSAPSVRPPPMPVRQISSDGHVFVGGHRRSSKARVGNHNNVGVAAYDADTPRRLDRLCATESAASASPPARPIRQVSRPMNVDLFPQLPPPHLAVRSTGSMLIPPSLPRRQVTTQQEFVVNDAAANTNSDSPVSRSSSQSLSRELLDPQALRPPSKPVRQVSGDAVPVFVELLKEPNHNTRPAPSAPNSDPRRSKRQSFREGRRSSRDDDSNEPTLAGPRGRGLTSVSAADPLTPLPSAKAPLLFTARMMSPSSSSNASTSSSSRSSLVARHRRGDLAGGPLRQ